MIATVLEDQLELLLERSEDAAAFERTAFDRAAAPHGKRVVIYGAGGLGIKTIRGLREHGVEPVAVVDRNPALHGLTLEGVPVFSPERGAAQFRGDAVFVVAVWNHAVPGGASSIARDLRSAGCQHVVPFIWLFWKYPETFLPHYLVDLPSRIEQDSGSVRAAFSLLSDARSRNEFLHQLEFRLTGNFSCLLAPDPTPQYFPTGKALPSGECFVDCGAYDGDTLKGLADWTGGKFRKAIAFEADPANFAALTRTVAADSRLRDRAQVFAAAVGKERGTLRFQAAGLSSSAVCADGEYEVSAVPLDEALAGERATYIKMDIEGSEVDALRGASAIIGRDRPRLAICSYHVQDHLWRIPNLIGRLLPDSRLHFRTYAIDGWELVCYATPRESPVPFFEESA